MVEFAVFLPILLLLFAGIVVFGMGFWNHLHANAAQDGAAYAVVNRFNAANITVRSPAILRKRRRDRKAGRAIPLRRGR